MLEKISLCDGILESNLCTMFQTVRGTKQYWFIRQSELRCMLRNFGLPTSFLTSSCAEYEASDISEYLHKVNANSSKDIAKLCVEDPISVSRQFSSKFHVFFKTVIIDGSVFGQFHIIGKKNIKHVVLHIIKCYFGLQSTNYRKTRSLHCTTMDKSIHYMQIAI